MDRCCKKKESRFKLIRDGVEKKSCEKRFTSSCGGVALSKLRTFFPEKENFHKIGHKKEFQWKSLMKSFQ